MTTFPLIKRSLSITRFLGALLVLALLAGVVPQPALAAPTTATVSCNTKYTVKSGDTLSSIAAQYKISWTELAAANDLKTPYTIFIGEVLCVPVASGTTSGSTSSSSSSNKASFSLALDGKNLVIKTSKFPTKNFYYVKVAEGRFHAGSVTYKLGILKVGKNPDHSYTYKLPNELNSADYVLVCLKNVVTDVNTCRSIKR
ncbi:MAG: LysM peptidoglycan-binding domain-containing protein [Anaerolineales bacterium]|nr:MAG: LysM peptidoglycan-binding domain-containing protein [Anaerolineales bacterium]